MTVVSSKDFITNEEKYFDMALYEDVCIKKGVNIFHLVNGKPFEDDVIFEPNEEFYGCISATEFRKRVRDGIHNIFTGQ